MARNIHARKRLRRNRALGKWMIVVLLARMILGGGIKINDVLLLCYSVCRKATRGRDLKMERKKIQSWLTVRW
jgi:hypothetical protein